MHAKLDTKQEETVPQPAAETPTKSPTDASAETPSETPTVTPAETPAETPKTETEATKAELNPSSPKSSVDPAPQSSGYNSVDQVIDDVAAGAGTVWQRKPQVVCPPHHQYHQPHLHISCHIA